MACTEMGVSPSAPPVPPLTLTTVEKVSHELPGISHHIRLGKSFIASIAIPSDLTQTPDQAHLSKNKLCGQTSSYVSNSLMQT